MVWHKRSPKVYDSGVHIVEGRFELDGSSDPTNVQGKGIKSVVHTSTGLFTITLDREYVKLMSATATVGLRTPDDVAAQVGKVAVTSNPPTVQIAVLDAGTLADVAADGYGDNAVSFCLILRDKSLQ